MKNNVKTLSLCLGLASLALGQTTTAPIYQSSILAGIPTPNGLGDNGSSQFAIVSNPQGVALDSNGNIFVADTSNSRIRKIDAATGVISTWATSGVSSPVGIVFDSKGDMIVVNNGNNGQIIRIPFTATGTAGSTTVIAGQNVTGTYGEDGSWAYGAFFNSLSYVAIDANDDLFISDASNNRIREIPNTNGCMYTPFPSSSNNNATTTCKVYTIAGSSSTPQMGTSCGTTNTCTPVGTDTLGDGGPALAARVQGPSGIAVTPDGTKVYVASNSDNSIRVIDMTTGLISRLIGNCTSGNTIVTCASGSYPDKGSTGAVSTLGDGRLAVNGTINGPRALYLDNTAGILYFTDSSNNRIRTINLSTGIVNTIIGGGGTSGDAGTAANSGLLTSLSLSTPYGIWVQNGLVYWTETGNNRVRVADPVASLAKTLVNQPRSTGSGGPGTNAYLGFATSLTSSGSPRVAVDGAGNVYIVEASTNKIRKVTTDGVINDWAGTGGAASTSKTNGDSGPAVVGQLSAPQQVAFDSKGNAYIADAGINRIRMVTPAGVISTVVGRNQITSCSSTTVAAGQCFIDKSNYVGDGGTPLNAVLSGPQGIAVDASGNLIIADTGHHAIRYVNMANNVITTIAGGTPATDLATGKPLPNGPTDGRSGLGNSGYQDSTDASYALFNNPRAVAVDSNGNIFIADYSNSAGRELLPLNQAKGNYAAITMYGSGNSSGTAPSIPTGTGSATVPGRIRMSSSNATSIAVDTGGNIYYALAADNRVNVVTADQSKIYEVAGGGSNDVGLNYTSSNGLNLQLPAVTGVAVDSEGTVYTADRNGLVKKLVCTKNCLPLK